MHEGSPEEEGSVVRVYLREDEVSAANWVSISSIEKTREDLRDSAITKLMTGQPLTEDEARTMVGAPPSFIPDNTPATLETPNPEGTP